MLTVDPEQIQANALDRLRVAAKRPDVEFQVIVVTRPVPSKWLTVALAFAAAAAAWFVPEALGLDLTLDIPSRRLRHVPTALLAVALWAPLFMTRNWSLGFCSDGSVLLANNGFAGRVSDVQTIQRPEIVLEDQPPLWRPPRIGVDEWVWQVNFNDSLDKVPAWLDRRRY